MKRRALYIFAFLLLGSVFGFLAFSPSENASDQDFCLNGILDFCFDLQFQAPNAVSLLFETHPDTDPLPFYSLRISYFQSVNLLTNKLRL